MHSLALKLAFIQLVLRSLIVHDHNSWHVLSIDPEIRERSQTCRLAWRQSCLPELSLLCVVHVRHSILKLPIGLGTFFLLLKFARAESNVRNAKRLIVGFSDF